MSGSWTTRKAQAFWRKRTYSVLLHNQDKQASVNEYREAKRRRTAQRDAEFYDFCIRHNLKDNPEIQEEQANEKSTVLQLEFWIKFSSWSYCSECNSIQPQQLQQTFMKTPQTKVVSTCPCKNNRYVVPVASDIPDALKHLTSADVLTLRPLVVHCGEYVRMQHGYREKTGILRATWSTQSVLEKIEHVPDPEAKQRCSTAYNYLMNSDESSYRSFVQKRERYMSEDKAFQTYHGRETKGIECCLWPHLYPYTTWCETCLTGQESRLSSKVSFIHKVLSNLPDYGMQYELLQFQYDRWLFKTITGAISTARRLKCSPARALSSKTFSAGYWQWQHRFLVDAMRQFGYPSLFITISPYEWTFPAPEWLNSYRRETGCGPTNLAAFETMHFAHTLEQLIRGYICGSTTARWRNHLLRHKRDPKRSNINTYFYRFEFQHRGTLHVHLLVWLKDISNLRHSSIRADIPWKDKEQAFLVTKLQKSDKRSLPLRPEPTEVVQQNNSKVIKLHHPAEAFAMNLRAYISTVTPTLKCSMDFQTTDGKAMILRYVTSYVAKWKDAYSNDGLYSIHTTPYEAAYRHMREYRPCEPEMWMQMSSMKISWSSSRTKRYAVPTSTQVNDNKVYKKYLHRPPTMENLSLTQWLREVNERAITPKPYSTGTTLVGLQFLSPFKDEFFHQDTIATQPHRSTASLTHPQQEQFPENIRFFAAAVCQPNSIWRDLEKVHARFEAEGNRDYYVANIVAYIKSLQDVYTLCQMNIIHPTQMNVEEQDAVVRFPLNQEQRVVLEHVKTALQQRNSEYNAHMSDPEPSLEDEDDVNEEEVAELPGARPEIEIIQCPLFQNINWKKFITIRGKPGVGKTHTLLACIEDCVRQHRSVVVATPTGYLAAKYRALFQEGVLCDTIHSLFNYPVVEADKPFINWRIADYELLIIDELSMVSQQIFKHIVATIKAITVRPVVMLSGDEAQQQPIATVAGKIVQVQSIMQDTGLAPIVHSHTLRQQHRCVDQRYNDFLCHIRHHQPTQAKLDDIQSERILCTEHKPSDEQILTAIKNHPTATFLTVSKRAANRVNSIVIEKAFKDQEPLCTAKCDCDMAPIPLYTDMRVMISQNRDKATGVVNGQTATVHMVRNCTIFLKLPNGNLVNTYPVTYISTNNERRTVYPFVPAYALTICKAQGQTLQTAIIWFDVPTVPAGSAYVALSRVKRLSDLYFMVPMQRIHFKPVSQILHTTTQ